MEDFWALYNHIELASRLAAGCDYSLFKVTFSICSIFKVIVPYSRKNTKNECLLLSLHTNSRPWLFLIQCPRCWQCCLKLCYFLFLRFYDFAHVSWKTLHILAQQQDFVHFVMIFFVAGGGPKSFPILILFFSRFQKHLPFYHNVAGGHQKRFVSFWKLFFIERSACYFIVAGGYQQVFHF